MIPTGQLMAEQRLVERVIDDLRLPIKDVYARKGIDPACVDQIVDSLETYADRCRHRKEENILPSGLSR